MEDRVRRYKSYSRNIKALLAFSGLWPESNPTASGLLALAALFTNSAVALSGLNFCLHHVSDIMVLTRCMGMVLSMTTSILKICTFLLHRQDLVYLNDFLSRQYTQDLKNLKEDRPRLLNRIVLFTYFLYIQTVAGWLTIALYVTIPLIAWGKTGKFLRMFPAIYPFKYSPGGIVHWSLFFMELLAGVFLCSVTSGVDCAFGMFSLQMCGELQILSKRFESLKVSPDYKDKLRDCMKRHYMMLNAKSKLESLFGFLTIWMAISAGVVLCTLIFQFTESVKNKSTSLHLGLLSFYIVLKFLQVFTYAWYGDVISQESEVCLHSIFNGFWTDKFSSQFRNDILIVLIQKPTVLKAKGCMPIQLDIFLKIVNTSVSYFFLLQALNEELQ